MDHNLEAAVAWSQIGLNRKSISNDKAADKKMGKWLERFTDWIGQVLKAVAEARIPPSKMPLISQQGVINLVTGALGVTLYTIVAYINAGGRALGLASQLTMTVIAAILLFASAVVVIFTARGPASIVDDWKRTTSVFIVLWLLSLFAFIVLTYPLLLITGNIILLDKIAYSLAGPFDPPAWVYDLIKSLVCTFIAGLILIYRTRLADPRFSLKSKEPWVWLVFMTLVVGFVFDVSVYLLGAIRG
jgi:hypothetical protein